MRQIFIAATVFAAAGIAVPSAVQARSYDVRIEAHGGPVWSQGHARGQFGISGGADTTVVGPVFVGAEVTADKYLTKGARFSLGAGARAGVDVPLVGKLYAVGGYATRSYRGGEGAWNLGAGVQHSFLFGAYGKIEYRHTYAAQRVAKADAVLLGIGTTF